MASITPIAGTINAQEYYRNNESAKGGSSWFNWRNYVPGFITNWFSGTKKPNEIYEDFLNKYPQIANGINLNNLNLGYLNNLGLLGNRNAMLEQMKSTGENLNEAEIMQQYNQVYQ